jgi:uncharacterized protein YciI
VPLFVIHCLDRPDALETRLAARPAHLDHLRANAGLKLAGPLLDAAGDPAGSLLIVEAEDIGSVRTFCDTDPYVKAGIFESVEIRPFRLALGAL